MRSFPTPSTRSHSQSALERLLAHSLGRLCGESRPEVLLAAALVTRQVQRGDVCVDLPALVEEPPDEAGGETPATWPPLADWLIALRASPLVAPADASGSAAPLVLDAAGRLYLRRFFDAEQRVSASCSALAGQPTEPASTPADAALRESIERLVPADPGEPDGPARRAARIAAHRRLCLITGGPGTGKTTTAARVLAVLVEQSLRAGRPAPRIALAAPTGKAAARLAEAVSLAKGSLSCADVVRASIPGEASTLHRLLRIAPHRSGRRSSEPSLRFDVVLVDEASMVDLSLMARLVSALPAGSRLVLLGDADQLASVEAGAVFADLCGPGSARSAGSDGETPSAIASCVVTLTHSHRYSAASGIGALAEAIRIGDAARVLDVLADPARPDVQRVEPGTGATPRGPLRESILAGYSPFAGARMARERLAALGRFRVLCAVREGPFGVLQLNRQIDALLVRESGLAAPGRGDPALCAGRPILITRNAPHLALWNGDVGVLARAGASAGDGLRAFFERNVERRDSGPHTGELRSVAAVRLPAHEPVFAMSVHKSQGSEFDEVALVLPPFASPGQPLPLLTRELVYTAVTRARSRVVIHASAEVLAAAIAARIRRASGLRDALWGRAR